MKLHSSKARSFGKLYNLFCAVIAITLLALIVPHGASAIAAENTTTTDNTKKEVTVPTGAIDEGYYYKIVNDTDSLHVDAFAGYTFTVYINGELEFESPLIKTDIDSLTLPEDYQKIPIGAKVGIDYTKDKYRLHTEYYDDDHDLYDVYVEQFVTDENLYESYAWYGNNEKALADYPDLKYTVGTDPEFTPTKGGESVTMYAEIIGKVPSKFLNKNAGHKAYRQDYFVNNHDHKLFTEEKEVLDTYCWEGATAAINKEGILEVVSYDKYSDYFECAHVTAVPKDGYQVSSWTINGKEYQVGKEQEITTVKFGDTYEIYANYKPVTKTAQTNDSLGYALVVIGLIAVAGACGAFVTRKVHNK